MSALMNKLAEAGVTAEDLDQAAAVALFEKVAAAEEIDLSQYSADQVEQLFGEFQSDILPSILEKNASTEEPAEEPTEGVTLEQVQEKVASLSQDDTLELFEKQASAEGYDLDAMAESDLVELYGKFANAVLPAMVANGGEPVSLEQVSGFHAEVEKQAQIEEAQVKLAEADMLGRHMARSFHDELEKRAGIGQSLKNFGSAAATRGKDLLAGSQFKARNPGTGLVGAALGKGVGAASKGEARKVLAARGAAGAAGAAALGGAALGAKKLMDKRKAKKDEKEATASSPVFEALAMDRANEIATAGGIEKEASSEFDAMVDARAIELLEANGYTFDG